MESFFTLGTIKIKKTAALAPMAGVTDRAFRTLCKEQGAALLTGEMASSTALTLGDKKTASFLQVDDALRPMGVQLFGHDPMIVARSIEKVLPFAPDFIDLNMGCPAPKVCGPGGGSSLMKDPQKAERMVALCVAATDIPITVKMRTGWDSSAGAVDFAKRMAGAGAKMICVHGRTREQMYTGKADWKVIAEVKHAVDVPVVGNGDITSAEEALQRYEETGVDLVSVGRGARCNPFLFAQINAFFETGEKPKTPSCADRIALLTRLFDLMCEDRPERIAFLELRKFAAWFLCGVPGAARLRAKAHSLTTKADLDVFLAEVAALPEQRPFKI